jgi:dihydrolipoamide dehydrogenase
MPSMESFDVVVIGAGPAGYVAAIRSAQLGLQVACVEQWRSSAGRPQLGGTCLNVGCIPSKALLDSSHQYEHARHGLKTHGINIGEVRLDLPVLQERKDKIVKTLTQGITGLFRQHKIQLLSGKGRLAGRGQVVVRDSADGTEATVEARHIVIATGSVPQPLLQAPIDETLISSSTGALAFTDVPRRLGVIGAGVIGLELGSVWRRLGSEVVLFEALDDLLPQADRDVAVLAKKLFSKQGLDIRLAAKVRETQCTDAGVRVTYAVDNRTETAEFDRLIVAVGRQPNTTDLGAKDAGLLLDARGFVSIDEHYRTNLPGVYAIGDVVTGPMLAHKAFEEGVAVAELIVGEQATVNYAAIPWVIYTAPEIAWVGQTEQNLQAAGHPYRSGSFPFLASGRARAMGETEGFVKVLGDAVTDRLLGVHVVGTNASELIAEAVLALEFGASTEDLARTVHAHPTLAEALHEAALAVAGRSLHL